MLKKLLIAMLAVFTLASCSMGSNAAIDKDIMQGILASQDFNNEEVSPSLVPANFKNFEISDFEFLKDGILGVKGKADGMTYLYSLPHQASIAKGFHDGATFTLYKSGNEFLIQVTEPTTNGNRYYVYDNIGNLIEEANSPININYFRIYNDFGKLRLDYDSNNKSKSFIYQNSALFSSDALDEANGASGADIDLDIFGLKGYKLAECGNGLGAVYNDKGEICAILNLDGFNGFTIDGKAYKQKRVELPNDSEEYDFIDEGVKYALVTESLELRNGNKKSVKCDFVISDNAQLIFKLKNGKPTEIGWIYTTIRKINKHKLLDDRTEVILDNKLKIKADYTGQRLELLQGFGDGAFNPVTKLVYDNNGKIINNLYGRDNLAYNKDYIVSTNGKEAVVTDYRGDVVYKKECDELYTSKYSDFIVFIDGDFARVRYNDGRSDTYPNPKIDFIDKEKGIFILTSGNSSTLFVGEQVKKLSIKGLKSYKVGHYIHKNAHEAYIIEMLSENNSTYFEVVRTTKKQELKNEL